MRGPCFSRFRAAMTLLLACVCASAFGQAPGQSHQPTISQKGKDVVWEVTAEALVEKMLDMAKVTPRDVVMDLGSGDGRIVIAAAKRGAQAIGVEYDPGLVKRSRRRAEEEGVAKHAKIVKADLFETDLSQATVITMFLRSDLNLKLRPKILALEPGTRIVSNAFDMGDWKPDEIAKLGHDAGCGSRCTALMWIVPAKVAGAYALPQGELVLKQEFQVLSGSLTRGGATHEIEGRVRGEALVFHAGGQQYHGHLEDGKLVLR